MPVRWKWTIKSHIINGNVEEMVKLYNEKEKERNRDIEMKRKAKDYMDTACLLIF